ncbi:MAG: hypothetical protein KIT07_03275 [Anaerolineales bacterium]|nr:hypothetical protein [Anaerolineales bacterium]
MTKANFFVFVQFAAIGAILLTGPWLAQPPLRRHHLERVLGDKAAGGKSEQQLTTGLGF